MSDLAPKFDLYMLPADNGDCLWLEYESGDSRMRILIDCGTEDTWHHLKHRLGELPEDQRHFDLLVITHIDDDHIGGALPLLTHWRALGLTFGEVWFNDVELISSGDLGVAQGLVLSKLLGGDSELRKVWNRSVGRKALQIPNPREGEGLPIYEFGELQLTLLSPTKRQLSRLKKKWNDFAESLAKRKAREPTYSTQAEKKWLGAGTTTLSAAPRQALDSSVHNGSSIAFLATYRGVSLLFGADAFPGTISKSLTHITPLRQINCYKVSHHGSIANITPRLLSQIGANHYLISTSGAVHNHPDIETLDLLTAGGTLKTLHFNYSSDQVRNWIRKNPRSTSRNYLFEFVNASNYHVNF